MTLPRHSPTVTEASWLIGVSGETIRRWIKAGRLKGYKRQSAGRQGWHWRLDPEDVDRERNGQPWWERGC